MAAAFRDHTPCPPPQRVAASNDKVGAWLSANEATATASDLANFKKSFQDVKPRRPLQRARSSLVPPSRNANNDDDTFNIYVRQTAQSAAQAGSCGYRSRMDASVASQESATTSIRPLRRSSSLFAQPAQRNIVDPGRNVTTDSASPPLKRRMSVVVEDDDQLQRSHANKVSTKLDFTLPRLPESGFTLAKEPRRRTMFVPSEDTTMPTIHPGHAGTSSSFKAARSERPHHPDVFIEIAEDTSQEQSEQRLQARVANRASRPSLGAPPRRAPLGNVTARTNLAPVAEDVAGSGAGKENLRPDLGGVRRLGKKRASILLPEKSFAPQRDDILPTPFRDWEPQSATTTNAAQQSPSRVVHGEKSHASHLWDFEVSNPAPLRARPIVSDLLQESKRHSLLPKVFKGRVASEGPAATRQDKRRPIFSVLQEDVKSAEMYEEDWINNQETSMSQLINSLFESVGHTPKDISLADKCLRRTLLRLHQDEDNTLLYKRLQASLQFGALAIPQETLANVSRLKDDCGQRQRFLDLWLKTYNLSALQACAEVVFGREITSPQRPSGNTSPGSDTSSQRCPASSKVIATFFRTFLIGNEDVGPRRSTISVQQHDSAAMWRRTVLRSLMLIILLDRAKTAGVFGGCLFQASSPCKSSTAVVQALSKMLLPSIGDMTRVLGHLKYCVSHVQYPLQEFEYRVDNLATDLRDGIRFVRLVESLIFSPTTSTTPDGRDVTTTMLPTEMFSGTADGLTQQRPSHMQSWVLSQQLKYPCISRSQKVHNVQVGLSALQSVREMRHLLANVTAEDIVDGHREKTVGLLWSLVSQWGLQALIDVRLLKRDIARLDRAWNSLCARTRALKGSWAAMPPIFKARTSAKDTLQTTLQHWAYTVGRKHGVEVQNLSTSFADGRAFEGILAEYAGYALPDGIAPSEGSRLGMSVPQLLKGLGCSKAFIALFPIPVDASTNWSTIIPTSKTVVPLLAFLASRLVPLSVPHVAAAKIQKAWRRSRLGWEVRRRVVCRLLAKDCAEVVRFRERIETAAATIQRAWRARERRLLGE